MKLFVTAVNCWKPLMCCKGFWKDDLEEGGGDFITLCDNLPEDDFTPIINIFELVKQTALFCADNAIRAHIGLNEYERMNWLHINDRFKHCITVVIPMPTLEGLSSN